MPVVSVLLPFLRVSWTLGAETVELEDGSALVRFLRASSAFGAESVELRALADGSAGFTPVPSVTMRFIFATCSVRAVLAAAGVDSLLVPSHHVIETLLLATFQLP